jgi:hypothetical protein
VAGAAQADRQEVAHRLLVVDDEDLAHAWDYCTPRPHRAARRYNARLARRLHSLVDRGIVLGIATFAVYAWVAPATFVTGDNAELAAVGALGGVPHPTGYPVYAAWLRAWSWLPGSPAHAAALATAMLGAGAVVAMFHAARAWGARPLAATLACAIVATGPVVMQVHAAAEVFALNDLVVAVVVWLAAERGPLRGVRRAVALGLVAGLGLGDHLTCALLAPVGVLGALRGAREAGAERGRAVAGAIAGLAVGLASYAYLFVAADTPASWGAVRSVDDLVRFVTRREYGGFGAFSPNAAEPLAAANLAALATTLLRSWLWVLAPVGVAALVAFAVRRDGARLAAQELAGESRAGWVCLLASWLLAGPLLVARFDLDPVGMLRFVCERFHVLPTVLLAVPVAVGLDRAAAVLAGRIGRPLPAVAPVVMAAVAAVAPIVAGMRALPALAAVDSPAVEAGVRNMLRPLPRDAVVLVDDDELVFGSTYVQQLLGERADVAVVARQLVARAWYRDRLAARGVALDAAAMDAAPSATIELVRQLLATGRPVFVDRHHDRVFASFVTYPLGVVFRVLPPGAPQRSIDDIVRDNEAAFARFDLGYPRPGADDGYATVAQLRYVETWRAIAVALRQLGRDADADRAWHVVATLAPGAE